MSQGNPKKFTLFKVLLTLATFVVVLAYALTAYLLNKNEKEVEPTVEHASSYSLDTANMVPLKYLKFDDSGTFSKFIGFDETAIQADLGSYNSYEFFEKISSTPYTTLSIPSVHNGKSVTSIDCTANKLKMNEYGSHLTALIVPNSVKSIASGSFWGLASLEYVSVPFVGTEPGFTAPSATTTFEDYAKMPFHTIFSEGASTGTSLTSFSRAEDVSLSTDYAVTAVNAPHWYYGSNASSGSSIYYTVPRKIEKVVITADTQITDRPFFLMDSLKEVVMEGDTVTSVGVYTFSELTNLEKVILSNKISMFRDGMFTHCGKLKEVHIPEKVSEIPNGAFENCETLETISLPTGITRIGNKAFYKCKNLATIKSFSGDTEYTTYEYNLPSGLLEIGVQAFYGCGTAVYLDTQTPPKNWTLFIPGGVNSIGLAAFGDMFYVTEITVPFVGGSRTAESGTPESAFGYIFGETSLTGGTASGTYYSASQCSGSYAIPMKLLMIDVTNAQSIGPKSMANLTSVKTITINKSCSAIAAECFANNVNLTSLTIPFAGVTGDYTSFAQVFGTSSKTGTVATTQKNGTFYVPETLIYVNITNQPYVKTGTFKNCIDLQEVKFSENTYQMEAAVFENNEDLMKLTLPFVGRVRGILNYGWNSVSTSSTTAQSDWLYGGYAYFQNRFHWIFSEEQSGNATQKFAASTWREYKWWHQYCGWHYSWAYQDYYVYIPNDLTEIIILDDYGISYDAFDNLENLQKVEIKKATYIQEGAFQGCSSITDLKLPFIGYDSESVNDAAHTFGHIFGDNSGSLYYEAVEQGRGWGIPKTLRTITITGDCDVVNDYSFANLESVTSIAIEKMVSKVGNYAFANDINCAWFTFNENSSFKTIGNYSFYNCLNIIAIENVCPAYKEEVQKGSEEKRSIFEFGSFCFAKTSISNIDFEVIKKTGDYTFAECANLTTVTIPSSVETLGAHLFSACPYLSVANVSGNVLKPYMFEMCESLLSIDISRCGEVIPEGIFNGCKNLTWDGLTLNTVTTKIEKNAFKDCESLDNFVIPGLTETIEDGAFQGITKWKFIQIPNTVTSIGSNVFDWSIGDFYIRVFKPRDKWPVGWTDNWNCENPVIYAQGDSSLYTFEFNADLKGYLITGVISEDVLTGIVTLPDTYNMVSVKGIKANALKDQPSITKLIVPERYTVIENKAFITGSRTDVYLERSKANRDKLYSSYEINAEKNEITEPIDETSWVNAGLIFYKDSWNYTTTKGYEGIPFLRLDAMSFETVSDKNEIFNGASHVLPLASASLHSEVLVENASLSISESIQYLFKTELDEWCDLFDVSYRNNVKAGTADLKVTLNQTRYLDYLNSDPYAQYFDEKSYGEAHFTIKKATVFLYSAGKQDEREYIPGTRWSISEWKQDNVYPISLDNYTITGTLRTTAADVGTYTTLNGGIEQVNIRIYLNGGGNVTDNFNIVMGYVEVKITPMVVNIEWTGGLERDDVSKVYAGTKAYAGTSIYGYDYTGSLIEPKAVARSVSNGQIYNQAKPTIQLLDSGAVKPHITTGHDYCRAMAYLTPDQYNYTINPEQGTFNVGTNAYVSYLDYVVCKPTVIITINDPDYLIPILNDSFVQTSFVNNATTTVTGLANGSKIMGKLISVTYDEMGNPVPSNNPTQYSTLFSVPTIVWEPFEKPGDFNGGQPGQMFDYIIYRDKQIENEYYDIINLTATVNLHWNDFTMEYLVDGNKVNAATIKQNNQWYEHIRFEVEGNEHVFSINATDVDDETITYSYLTYLTTTEPFKFKAVDTYLVGAKVERKNFNTINLNFQIEAARSNITYDLSALNREYNGEEVKVNDISWTKKGADHVVIEHLVDGLAVDQIGVEWYDQNKNVIQNPIIPGVYYVRIKALQNDYFNAIDTFERFVISPRTINLHVDHENMADSSSPIVTPTLSTGKAGKLYDAVGWQRTVSTADLRAAGFLLENDIFTGSLSVASELPKLYDASVFGDFYWLGGNFIITNTNSGEIVTSYYKVVMDGTFEIKYLQIDYTAEADADCTLISGNSYQIDYDEVMHYAIITVNDPADCKIYYNTTANRATATDVYNPTYTNPGSYHTYFWIEYQGTPNVYEKVSGVVDILINKINITYKLPTELLYDTSTSSYYIVYNAQPHFLEVLPVVPNPCDSITYTLRYTDPLTNKTTTVCTNSSDIPQVQAIGHYSLSFKLASNHYNSVSDTVDFDIRNEGPDPVLNVDYEILIDGINYATASHQIPYDGRTHKVEVNILSPNTGDKYYATENFDDIKRWTKDFQTKEYYKVDTYDNWLYLIIEGKQPIKINAQFEITPTDFDSVTVTGWTGNYDGKMHSPTVEVELNSSVNYADESLKTYTVYYCTQFHGNIEAPNSPWTTTLPEFSDCGTYTVFVMVTADNYKNSQEYVTTITITKHEPSVFFPTYPHSGYVLEGKDVLDNPIKEFYVDEADLLAAQEVYHEAFKKNWTEGLWTETQYQTFWLTSGLNSYQSNVAYDVLEIEYDGSAIEYSDLKIQTVHDGVKKITYYNAGYENGEYKHDKTRTIAAPKDLGIYYVEIQYLETKNCKSTSTYGWIKIVPKTLHVEYTAEKEYNGDYQEPDVYVLLPDGTKLTPKDDLELIRTDVSTGEFPIDVYNGYKYSIAFKDPDKYKNYLLDIDHFDFAITKKKILISFQDRMDYNNDSKAPWEKADGWDDNLFADYSKFASDHYLVAYMTTAGFINQSHAGIPMGAVNDYILKTGEFNRYSIKYTIHVYEIEKDSFGNPTYNLDGSPKLVVVGYDTNGDEIYNDVLDQYYNIEFDIKVTIEYPSLVISSPDVTIDYDGQYHSVSDYISISNSSTRVTTYYVEESDYQGENTVYNLTTPPQYKNAGVHKVYFVCESATAKKTYGSFTLTINKIDLEITATGFDIVYDGEKHTIEYTVDNINEVLGANTVYTLFFEKSKYKLTDLSSLFNENDFSMTNPLFYLFETAPRQVDKANEYWGVLFVPENENFKFGVQFLSCNISKRGLYVTLPAGMPTSITTVYSGSPYQINIKNATIDTTLTPTTGLLTDHQLETAIAKRSKWRAQTKSADAFTYYGATDFDFGYLSIVSLSSGKEIDYTNYYPIIGGGLSVRIDKASLNPFEYQDGEDFQTQFSTKPYIPQFNTNTDGEITIKYYPADETGTATGACIGEVTLEYDYDANAYIETYRDIAIETTKNVGHYLLISEVAEGTNFLGSTTPIRMHLEITKYEASIIWDNLETTFNGEYQKPDVSFVDPLGNTIDMGQYLTINNHGLNDATAVIDADTYACAVSVPTTWADYANYVLVNDTEQYTINKLHLTLNVTGTKDYDSAPWNTVVTITDFTELDPTKVKVTGSDPNSAAYVYTTGNLSGEYNRSSVFDVSGIFLRNVDDVIISQWQDLKNVIQYNIEIEVVGSVVIKGEAFEYKAINRAIPYDDREHDISACFELINPTSTKNLTITYWHPDPTDPTNYEKGTWTSEPYKVKEIGVYSLGIHIVGTNFNNSVHKFVTLEITEAEAYINLGSASLDKDYDGYPITADVLRAKATGLYNGLNAEHSNLVFTFYKASDTTYSNPITTPIINAGNYKVVITSKGDAASWDGIKHFSTLNEVREFEIRPRKLILSVDYDWEVLTSTQLSSYWHVGLSDSNADSNKIVTTSNLYNYLSSYNVLYYTFESTGSVERGTYKTTTVMNFNTEKATTHPQGLYLLDFLDDKFYMGYKVMYDDGTITEDVSSNYEITLEFKLRVHYPYMTVNVDNVDNALQYTGNPLHGDVSVTLYGGAKVTLDTNGIPNNSSLKMYYSADGIDYSPTSQFYADSYATVPGTHKLYYKFEYPNHETAEGYYTLRISYVTRDITQDNNGEYTKEYDGTNFFYEDVSTNGTGYYLPQFKIALAGGGYIEYRETSPGSGKGDYYYSGITGTTLTDDFDKSKVTISLVRQSYTGNYPSAIDVGLYQYTVTIPSSQYYKKTTFTGTCEITPRTIYITGSKVYNFSTVKPLYNDMDTRTDFTYKWINALGQVEDVDSKITIQGSLTTSSSQIGIYKGNDGQRIQWYNIFSTNKDYILTVEDSEGNAIPDSINYQVMLGGLKDPNDEDEFLIEPVKIIIQEGLIDASAIDSTYTYNNGEYFYPKFVVYEPMFESQWTARYCDASYYTPGDVWNDKLWTTDIKKLKYNTVGTHETYIWIDAGMNYQHNGDSLGAAGGRKIIKVTTKIERAQTEIYFANEHILSKQYDGNEVLYLTNTNGQQYISINHTEVDYGSFDYKYFRWDDTLTTPDWVDMTGLGRPKNVGLYLMVITVPESDNYKSATVSQDFEITAFETEVIWDKTSFIYDGKVQHPKASIKSVAIGDKENEPELDYVIEVVDPTNVGGDLDSITVGSYRITTNIKDGANYIVSDKTKTTEYSIKPRPITISLSKIVKFGTMTDIEFNYEGKDINHNPTASGLEYKVDGPYKLADNHSLAPSTLVLNKNATTKQSTAYSVGTYTWKTYSYARARQVDANYTKVYGKGEFFDWDSAAGNGTIEIWDETMTSGGYISYANVTENYSIMYDITVCINHDDILFSAEPVTCLYDGKRHGVDVSVETLGLFKIEYSKTGADGTWTTSKSQFEFKNATIKPNEFYVRVVDPNGNFQTTEPFKTSVWILTKDASLDWADPYLTVEDRTYNGAYTEYPQVTFYDATDTKKTVSGPIDGVVDYIFEKWDEDKSEWFVVEQESTADVGKYKLTVRLAATENYDNAELPKEFEITKRQIVLQIAASEDVNTLNNYSMEYNGYVWTMAPFGYSVNGVRVFSTMNVKNIVAGHKFEGILQTVSANVGTYQTSEQFNWVEPYCIKMGSSDVTDNYEVVYSIKVKITKSHIVASCPTVSVPYDAQYHTIVVNVTKPVSGYVIYYADTAVDPNAWSINPVVKKAAGSYNIGYRVEADNYEPFTYSGVLIIEPLPDALDGLDYLPTYTYNGSAYPKPLANTKSKGTQTVKYFSKGVELADAPTEVGDYTFKLTIASDGIYEETVISEKTFRIVPKTVNIIWGQLPSQTDPLEFEYDGTTKVPTAKYQDINGTDVDITVTCKTTSTLAGIYTADLEITDPNYELPFDSEQFEIKKQKVTPIAIKSDLEFVYLDNIVVVDADGNTYDLDPDGTILTIHYADGSPDNVDPQFLYKIVIDSDINADGVNSKHPKHYFTLKLDDRLNYQWSDETIADKQVLYKINKIDFTTNHKDEEPVGKSSKLSYIWTGQAITPEEFSVIVRKKVGYAQVSTLREENDPSIQAGEFAEYKISYDNNVNLSTTQKAKVIITGINNYDFTAEFEYSIVDEVNMLTLKSDASTKISWVTAKFHETEYEADGITEKTPEYTEMNGFGLDSGIVRDKKTTQDDLDKTYLGKIYQGVTLEMIKKQFDHDADAICAYYQLDLLDSKGKRTGQITYKQLEDSNFIGTGTLIVLSKKNESGEYYSHITDGSDYKNVILSDPNTLDESKISDKIECIVLGDLAGSLSDDSGNSFYYCDGIVDNTDLNYIYSEAIVEHNTLGMGLAFFAGYTVSLDNMPYPDNSALNKIYEYISGSGDFNYDFGYYSSEYGLKES